MGFLSNVTWFKCIKFRNIVANDRVVFDFLHLCIEWTSFDMLSRIFVHCIAVTAEVKHRPKPEVPFLGKLAADKRYRTQNFHCGALFHLKHSFTLRNESRTDNIFDQQSASAPVKPYLFECNVLLDMHAWHFVQQHFSDF